MMHKAIALIKHFEGLRLQSYLCPAGVWTVGYGTTGSIRQGMQISEQQAEQWLLKALQEIDVRIPNNFKLNSDQKQALISFLYNVGMGALDAPSFGRAIRTNLPEVPERLLDWDKAVVNGVKQSLLGLTRRRRAESILWVSGLVITDNNILDDLNRVKSYWQSTPAQTFSTPSNQPIKLTDAFTYYKALPHQQEAIAWLDSQLTADMRSGFGYQFRGVPRVTPPVVLSSPIAVRDSALYGGTDLASQICNRMAKLGLKIFDSPGYKNIVYLEGVDADGTPNADKLDVWNDRRIVIEFKEGKPVIIGNWLATTEPGAYWTYNPMNAKGAARIEIDVQFRAWRVGMHGTRNPHEALVQVMPVAVYRDYNKDGFRTGDRLDTGLFGINQHHGYDSGTVGRNSAGCLVGQSVEGHRKFMRIIKTDPRYVKSREYIFDSTVLDGSKL